jgi:hypothetical protein
MVYKGSEGASSIRTTTISRRRPTSIVGCHLSWLRVSAPPYAVRSMSLSLPCSNLCIAPFGLGHGALGRGSVGSPEFSVVGRTSPPCRVFEMVKKGTLPLLQRWTTRIKNLCTPHIIIAIWLIVIGWVRITTSVDEFRAIDLRSSGHKHNMFGL